MICRGDRLSKSGVMNLAFKMILSVIAFLLLLEMQEKVIYAEDEKTISISKDLDAISYAGDIHIAKNGDYSYRIYFDNIGQSDTENNAVFTSYIQENQKDSLSFSKYKAIRLNISNNSNNSVKLSLSFTDGNQNEINIKADGYAIAEQFSEAVMTKMDNGYLELEEGFNGNILIPIEMFTESVTNIKTSNNQNLSSISLKLQVQGQCNTQIDINSVAYATDKAVLPYNNSFYAFLDGDDTIVIPRYGESIADYKILHLLDNTYSYITKGYENGITVTDDGRITISPDVSEQTIELKAVDEAGVVIKKKIRLIKWWNEVKQEKDFYAPADIKEASYSFHSVDKQDIFTIRIILLAILVFSVICYQIFYVRYIAQRRKEVEK